MFVNKHVPLRDSVVRRPVYDIQLQPYCYHQSIPDMGIRVFSRREPLQIHSHGQYYLDISQRSVAFQFHHGSEASVARNNLESVVVTDQLKQSSVLVSIKLH
jgi:hypothetical protein